MKLREELTVSYDEFLYETVFSSLKNTFNSIVDLPGRVVKNKIINSWKYLKSESTPEIESKLLSFYNFLFKKHFNSYSDLDFIFSGISEEVNEAVTVASFVNFYREHSGLLQDATFALVELFATLFAGNNTALIMAAIYVTVVIATYFLDNESELGQFLTELKDRVKKFVVSFRSKQAVNYEI